MPAFKPGDLILKDSTEQPRKAILELICDKFTRETKDRLLQLEKENRHKEFGTPIACLDKDLQITGEPPCPRGQGIVYTVGHYKLSPKESFSSTEQDNLEILEKERPIICRTSSEDSKIVCFRPIYKGSNKETIQAEISLVHQEIKETLAALDKKYSELPYNISPKVLAWWHLSDKDKAKLSDLRVKQRSLMGGFKYIAGKRYAVQGKVSSYPKVSYKICEVT